MSSVYEITAITKFSRYIDFLAAHKKEILICAVVRDTLYNIDYNSIKKLQSIGMTDLGLGGWIGYVYISSYGLVRLDKRSNNGKSIFAKLMLPNLKVEMTSRSLNDGNIAKIVINGINFAVNWRGLNIVVFDIRNMRLVDSVCFDFLPTTTTPFRRLFCMRCTFAEQEEKKKREKQVKKYLPLVHIDKKWAFIQEADSQKISKLIEKFDEGYSTISIVNSEGCFKELVNVNQFKEDFPRKDYHTQKNLCVEYEPDEEHMKIKLADMFFNTNRTEIPILQDGKIKALGRFTNYFDSAGRWNSRQVYRFSWDWIDESVAKVYFARWKSVLISSESWFLKGFKEAFSSWLNIEVYRDDLLDKCLAGDFDLLLYGADVMQNFPMERRWIQQVYYVLLAETVRRWLEKCGVELHVFSTEGELPGGEKNLSAQKELIGGTVGYLREGEQSYFIVDGSDYDKVVGEVNRLPNFHAGRRCVTEANSLTGNAIYFYGPCTAVGYASYSPDKNIESFLQKKLNVANLNYHVVNCGTEGIVGDATTINWLYRIMDTPVRSGDKMLLVGTTGLWGNDIDVFPIKLHKLMHVFAADKIAGKKLFVDPSIAHMNVSGYEMTAEFIYQEMKDDLRNDLDLDPEIHSKSFFSEHHLPIEANSHLDKLLKSLPKREKNVSDVGGAVVAMNSTSEVNRYFVQRIMEKCGNLYIFLIFEDETPVEIEEMKHNLEEYVKGFPVSIISLGKWSREHYVFDWQLVRWRSAPSREFHPAADTYIFARYIAPHLGIKKYFALADGGDAFVHRYNILKQEILQEEGIEWIEIPRI